LSNPTAIITGAAKRLGRQMALELADRGYDIVVHYNSSENNARGLADEIRGKGRNCRLFQADFSNSDIVEKFALRLFEDGVDYRVLINNASIFHPSSFMETDASQLADYFTIHFVYPFFLTRYFAAKASGGVVINILDTRVTNDDIDFFPYTLSKKTLGSFTRMAAKALAPSVRVNAICPGPVLPPSFEEGDMDEKIAKLPLRRRVDTTDIIKAMNYLLDNDSVTGDFLFVDGGMHL